VAVAPAPVAEPAPVAAPKAIPASPATPAAEKTPVAPKKAEPVNVEPAPASGPDQAEIDRMIGEAAYYLAEKRNFQPGFEADDWATAMAQVLASLKDGKVS